MNRVRNGLKEVDSSASNNTADLIPGMNTRRCEERTFEADPPELCDAYDAYLEWFQAKVKEVGTWISDNAPVIA